MYINIMMYLFFVCLYNVARTHPRRCPVARTLHHIRTYPLHMLYLCFPLSICVLFVIRCQRACVFPPVDVCYCMRSAELTLVIMIVFCHLCMLCVATLRVLVLVCGVWFQSELFTCVIEPTSPFTVCTVLMHVMAVPHLPNR